MANNWLTGLIYRADAATLARWCAAAVAAGCEPPVRPLLNQKARRDFLTDRRARYRDNDTGRHPDSRFRGITASEADEYIRAMPAPEPV